MALFITIYIYLLFEKVQSDLEDTCRDQRRFEKEPNKQYNDQNEKVSGQVL